MPATLREPQSSQPATPSRHLPAAAWRRFLLAWLLLPAFFLLTGGSLGWWEAWAYCAVVLVPMSFFVAWAARAAPELLQRRLKLKEGQAEQRRLLSWSSPVFVALFLLPGLDHRFGWSRVPVAIEVAALVLSLVGYLGVLGVFRANPWAGRTVETVPGQQVVSTGPYALVRHPMYAASVLLYLATPLALGTWWGLVPSVITVGVLVLRIGREEAFLVRELRGYAAYREKVRWRLVPGVW